MKNAQIIFLLIPILLFSSCRKDEEIINDEIILIDGTEGKINIKGAIVDLSGQPLPNVEIITSNSSVFSDDYGFFELTNLDLINRSAVLQFTKDNYIPGIKKISSRTDNKNEFIRVRMIPASSNIGSFIASAGGSVQANGGLNITFSANVIVDNTGSDYSGEVSISSYFYQPNSTLLNELMPGDLSALGENGENLQLETYGMMYAGLTSPSGEELFIKDGFTATINFPIPSELISIAPESIALWSLDERTGTWLQEGSAIKVNGNYIAQVSHFSFWNCDDFWPLVNIEGCLVDEDGNPMAYVSFKISIVDGGETRFGYTDEFGCFAGQVPKDQELEISLTDYCQNIDRINIGSFSMNAVLGNITTKKLGELVTFTGTLIACDMLNVSSGLIVFKFDNGATRIYPVADDGTFEIAVPICTGEKVSIYGVDLTNLKESKAFEITINGESLINLDKVIVCEILDEYLVVKINGGTQTYLNPSSTIKGDKITISYSDGLDLIGIELDNSALGNSIPKKVFLSFDFTPLIQCIQDNSSIDCEGNMLANLTNLGDLNNPIEGTISGNLFASGNLTPTEIEFRVNVDRRCSSISGRIWEEVNFNDIRDNDEPLLEGIPMTISNSEYTETVMTNANGEYELFAIPNENNTIIVDVANGLIIADENVGNDDSIDSDFDPFNYKLILNPLVGEDFKNIDAGIEVHPASFCEVNVEPICAGINGESCLIITTTDDNNPIVIVRVLFAGNIIHDSSTAISPHYVCQIENGQYDVEVEMQNGAICKHNIQFLAGYRVGTQFISNITSCDPFEAEVTAYANGDLGPFDYNWTNGSTDQTIFMREGETESVTINGVNNCNTQNEFTLEKVNLQITGRIWLDNTNGVPNIYDSSDLNTVKDVRITLWDLADNEIATFSASHTGFYHFFLNVQTADFYLTADKPGYQLVDFQVGNDPEVDSDFDPFTFRSDVFAVQPGCNIIENLDLGLRKP